jgi:tetratricopeptide (TPR) repeat protein
MRKNLTLAAKAGTIASAITGTSIALALSTGAAPRTVEQMIRNFRFVADFTPKDPEREISSELFWRYPLELPKVEFPVDPELRNPGVELPRTDGDGRAIQHLNRARQAYLDGDLESARKSLLSAKARYGKEHAFHRRTDYMLAYVFMNEGFQEMAKRHVSWDDARVKGKFSNAATFLSWAFNLKKDIPDPVVDKLTPKGLYNLAAIYFRYDRFAASFAAAEMGLDYLRASGRTDYRMSLRRISAENYIKNGTFLEAVQELDQALRQDYNQAEAAAIMHRAGDIYFNLNNYELAEEAYELGAKADESLRQISPAQLMLRAESLFWLKRFAEARMYLRNALEGVSFRAEKNPPSFATEAWASLRFADIHLALKDTAKAKLAYFKVESEYRGTVAAKVAKIRQACLELPFYTGNNVTHARADLEKLREDAELPVQAKELAWACHTGSFAARERTPEMVAKVRAFAKAYPESRFLKELVEPVRDTQALSIENYFARNDDYGAVAFFEENRKRLFPKGVPPKIAAQLFRAYSDIGKPAKAKEFLGTMAGEKSSDIDLLRSAAVLAEIRDARQMKKLATSLHNRKWTIAQTPEATQIATRVMESNTDQVNLPWLMRLYDHWSVADESQVCEAPLTLLTKAAAMPTKARKNLSVEKRITSLIDDYMPDLMEDDPSCAVTLLDLEFNVMSAKPDELAKRYLARNDWNFTPETLTHMWAVSESLVQKKPLPKAAQELWTLIVKKGAPGSPEVGFARARLDPSATEFEKIWK